MGVVDAGGCISATRHGTAEFEWTEHISTARSTRPEKQHVHPLRILVMASSNMFLICGGLRVEVRCGGGGRGRVYLRNPTWDSTV